MSKVRSAVKAVLPTKLFRIIEPYGHLLESVFWAARYGFPARDIRVIGVTGTNGKTTTSYMIHTMLVEAGYKSSLMTTVAYGVGKEITPQVAHMTTVSSRLLQQRIREYKKAGAEWLVLETTSHALAQYRVWGVLYEVAVVTNITHEHLDYHGTFENYKAAKRRMFTLAGKHGKKLGIVNADDPESSNFADETANKLSYGVEGGDVRASNVKLRPDGSSYTATVADATYNVECAIPGEFNVYNSLAAVSLGHAFGLSKQQIESGVAALKNVEGRMNTLDAGQQFSVIIDFAHTPDSFERLLSDLRKSTKGKLVVLFGSAGRRDEAKRWTQGEIAGKYADELVLTEEDDRDIDGNLILSQIAEGAERSGKVKDKDMFLVLNRSEAIKFAVSRVSNKADAVVLLGKGHEKTIERAHGEDPWDEVEEARTAIANT